MKQLVTFLLAVIYLGTASGATVNLHYCMGEFSGMDLGHSDDGPCSSCGMDKSSSDDENCCKDEQKVLKLNDAHKSAQVFIESNHLFPVDLPVFQYVSYPVSLSRLSESFPVVNAPPQQRAPLYISIRSIRI